MPSNPGPQASTAGNDPAERWALLRREVVVALPFALSLLPVCLSSGLLAFAPLGPDYVAKGITAALNAIIFGGIIAALFATSSFVIHSPRSNLALVQATAVAYFLGKASFAGNPAAVVVALAACVLLAGLFQILFAIIGVARIIRYTPHPVMAGFVNGAALSIVWSQIRPFIDIRGSQSGWLPFIAKPTVFVFILLLTAFVVGVTKFRKKLPAPFIGLGIGVLVFYAFRFVAPEVELGRTIGSLDVTLPPDTPVLDLWEPEIRAALLSAVPDIILIALAIAVLAIFESLLVFKMAQNLADKPLGSMRDIMASGAGNCASALTGGLAFSPASGQTRSVFREGGRTRIVPITISLLILTFTTTAPGLLAAIPVAAVSALLLHNGFQNFDRWSLDLFVETLRSPRSPERRRAWLDLAVIGTVMGVTITISVLPGVLAGVIVACVIFIANMSRPIVRRRYSGDVKMSKRMRSEHDAAILRETGPRRIVLELHGVLFFGNADDLSERTRREFAAADTVVLDCRGISDIDVSGATIMRSLFERSRRQRKHLFLCNVPPVHSEMMKGMVEGGTDPAVFSDLDSALEWMEERVLQAHAHSRGPTGIMPLEEHDFVQGLDDAERAALVQHLVLREFPAGAVLCVEGDPADRMWLLTKGSVSVRLRLSNPAGTRRIASCATGTTVGEMAFIQAGTRSASVIADEDTVCHELSRAAYDRILRDHPAIANKLLTNLSLELARRLRRTSDELRETIN